jgi:hypothetical protein
MVGAIEGKEANGLRKSRRVCDTSLPYRRTCCHFIPTYQKWNSTKQKKTTERDERVVYNESTLSINARDLNAKEKNKQLHGNTQRWTVTTVPHMLRIIASHIMPWHAWFQFPGRRIKTNSTFLQECVRS